MDKANLQKWALVAEIFGGIAVVVTLIFLVLETRENTSALKAQTYHFLTAELNDVRQDANEPDMSEMIWSLRQTGLEALDDVERWRVMNFVTGLFGVYESAYFALERGTLGAEEWARFHDRICFNRQVYDEIWNPERGGSIVSSITPQFRNFIESECQ